MLNEETNHKRLYTTTHKNVQTTEEIMKTFFFVLFCFPTTLRGSMVDGGSLWIVLQAGGGR